MEIIRLVKQQVPITGEDIAELLGVSRPTIRSDLAVLVMLGYLDAKPKVGYFLGKSIVSDGQWSRKLSDLKVKDVQSIPVVVRDTASVHDAVVTLFLENVGSLIVTDTEGYLLGVASRKDLLKVTLGNAAATSMPVGLVMTRVPNIITCSPEESVLEAGQKMINYQVDSLPVIVAAQSGDGSEKQEIVGRITKTTMTKLLIDLALKSGEYV